MADQVSRRTTLAGAAGLAAALPVLAACGDDKATDGSAAADPTASDSGTPTPTSTAAAGAVVGPTSDIPVGGGKIYNKLDVVVTQPQAGTFKAFGATCTHQGCQVSRVENDAIQCLCHFSKYSLSDGSVQGGPAPEPLPPVDISVENGQITLT